MQKHHDKNREPSRIEMSEGELEELIGEIKSSSLSENSKGIVINALLAFLWINRELEKKKLSIKKLARLIFGAKTEKVDPSK